MAGPIGFHSAAVSENPGEFASDGSLAFGTIGPIFIDADSHSVFLLATFSIDVAMGGGPYIVQFNRCDNPSDENNSRGDDRPVGPNWVYSITATGPQPLVTVTAIDPDPPSGTYYNVTIQGADDNGGTMTGALIAAGIF